VPGIVANNTSNDNAGDGIVLYDGSGISWNTTYQDPGLTVSGNTTDRNAYDGIHVDPTVPALPPYWPPPQGFDVTLTDNSANKNCNLGLDSPGSSPGPPPIAILDGAGNIARGNGRKIQCQSILCSK
jgi:hypothetical protein